MMYYELEIGGNTYKLRLTTRAIVSLEDALCKNPLMLFSDGELPKVADMCKVLHASLQACHHGYTMSKVYELFDEYMADGHTPAEFIGVILEIYKVSGLLGVEQDAEKN